MFQTLINAIKLGRLNKLLSELCDDNSCLYCDSFIPDRSSDGCRCAQSLVIEQALKKWGLEKRSN